MGTFFAEMENHAIVARAVAFQMEGSRASGRKEDLEQSKHGPERADQRESWSVCGNRIWSKVSEEAATLWC